MIYKGNPFLQFGGVERLLDTYPSAAGAWSLRRINSDYTGACIRVREDGGNTETDIGFDGNGDLDTAAITSHCGAANGYVTKWYGQDTAGGTGSGNDAIQTTTTDQPQIYNGSVLTDPNNGNVAMLFDGINHRFSITSITETQNFYMSFVFNRSSSGIISVGVGRSTTRPFPFLWFSDNTTYHDFGSAISHDTSQTQTGDFLYTVLRDGSDNIKFWENGSAKTTKTGALSSSTFDRLGIRSGNHHNGYMQECVFWASDQESNRSGIETDVNGYWGVF